MSRLGKKFQYSLCVLGLFVMGLIFFADYTIKNQSQHALYPSVDHIPENTVGVLLGTAKYVSTGRLNMYYVHRINAAVELFESKKIDVVLISADNGSVEYDEPTTMKRDLIERGIPEEKIYLDYAGFRTLDSMVRAKEIFGQTEFTVISQQFHNERAVYIAQKKGIDAIGFNAQSVPSDRAPRVVIREKFARVKTLLDLYLLNTQPKFLGEQIHIADPQHAS